MTYRKNFHVSTIYRLMGGDGTPINLKELRTDDMLARKALVEESLKQYEPALHDVNDSTKRRDKVTFVPNGQKDPITGADKLVMELVPRTKMALQIQKYIIKQRASFIRGNGVKLKPSDETSEIFKYVYNQWYKNKTDFYIGDIARRWMSETQVAVVFFGDAQQAKSTKKRENVRLKFKILSPLKGDYLYPYFDPDTESLTGLLREYEDEKGETKFDLYIEADPEVEGSRPVLRKFTDGDLESYEETTLPYPKLPLVYWDIDEPVCEDSAEAINQFEGAFSDFSDQIQYTADPILFGTGKAIDMPSKGTAGKFITGSEDADLKYLTPDNATDSRELHFKMLHKYIFSLNRAVLLDPEMMKNLSELSGAALERFLSDIFQEASDQQNGYFGLGIQRMVNFMLATAKDLYNKPNDETTIDAEFTKYRIDDMRETVEVLTIANGGKPLIDWQGSVSAAGIADDPEVAFERMQEDAERAAEMNVQTDGQDPAAAAAQRAAAAAGNGDQILEGDN